MIDAHVLNQMGGRAVRSPLDAIATLRDKTDAEAAQAASAAAANAIGSEPSEDVATDIAWQYTPEE